MRLSLVMLPALLDSRGESALHPEMAYGSGQQISGEKLISDEFVDRKMADSSLVLLAKKRDLKRNLYDYCLVLLSGSRRVG
jgi:hypothetical protein